MNNKSMILLNQSKHLRPFRQVLEILECITYAFNFFIFKKRVKHKGLCITT